MTARRWPIVTTIVFLSCLAVQAMLARTQGGQDERAERLQLDAEEYVAEHPYLHVPPGVPGLDLQTLKLARDVGGAVQAPDDDTLVVEQAELDARIARLQSVDEGDPFRRFGYVPAAHNWLALLTSPFVHAGWLHLFGNMWFLFFCGMNLEDRWGRVVFPLFYLAAGAVAALTHGLLSPHDTVPLVGASGAIAGLMGAFAVLFGKTRVRFALLVTLRPRVFSAPAYAVLPVWAAFEALFAFLLPGDGTAHWAHIGGFVFGVGAALVLRRTGVDHKLDDAVSRVATLGSDPRIDEARLLMKRGQSKLALAMLEGLAVEKPQSPHVQDALADAAQALGDDAREQKARARAAKLRASVA
jgi:membrane associated rhomboid family serine protease